MTNRLALLLATWFGSGYLPKAPGTWGTVFALFPLAWIAARFQLPAWLFFSAAIFLFPISVWAATRTARITGRKDPQIVVIDEVLGAWVAFAAAPVVNLNWCFAAFLLFRLFDIWKPWPIRRLESLPGGIGIMSDDLLAGAYAAIVIIAVSRLVPGLL